MNLKQSVAVVAPAHERTELVREGPRKIVLDMLFEKNPSWPSAGSILDGLGVDLGSILQILRMRLVLALLQYQARGHRILNLI